LSAESLLALGFGPRSAGLPIIAGGREIGLAFGKASAGDAPGDGVKRELCPRSMAKVSINIQ